MRVQDELHAEVVDDLVVELDVGIFLGDRTRAVEEEPIGELHDVGFVDGRDFLPAAPLRIVEREARDAGRGMGRDDLHPLRHARHDHVLDAGIEVFGVLPHDHEVDVLVARLDAHNRAHRPQIGVEVQPFAERDVRAREAFPNKSREWTFEGNFVLFDGIEKSLRERISGFFVSANTRLVLDPVEDDARRLEDRGGGFHDFRADTVARNECDSV